MKRFMEREQEAPPKTPQNLNSLTRKPAIPESDKTLPQEKNPD
jgi:hypothetical protein